GSAEERPLVEAVLRELPQPCAEMCVDLCGRTGLGAFAALLRAARLVISNDTGTSHVAAAVGVPSVVLYGGSAPDRWAPLDEQRHRRALIPVACRPCYHWHCPVGHVCMTGLTPETVWRHIRDALTEPVHTTPVQDGGARPCADFAS
ncbi:MAG TPA: glycosyltransferase family 9 protein, partial [Gammaproteobacteria bacterium]